MAAELNAAAKMAAEMTPAEISANMDTLLALALPLGLTLKFHSRRKEENNIDPDDGNSWMCSACKIPIFSTPFRSYKRDGDDDNGRKNVIFLHEQCATLRRELDSSDLHYSALRPLIIQLVGVHQPSTTRCSKCRAICGAMFYRCVDRRCSFRLDLVCSSTIKILHRSHEHRLMVIRSGPASFICSACGTRHDQGSSSDLVYVCHACCFWIHPDCATLPNAIVLQQPKHQHQHPLVLNYGRRPEFLSRYQDPSWCCAICGDIIRSWGVYICTKCHYYVHIMCAVADPRSFKPMLIREARLPDLVHLPIPNEYTSVVRYITDSTTTTTTAGGTSSSSDHPHDELLPLDQLHEHPLILHNDDHHRRRVCNICVQSISPPFYKCSECPDFFVHNCCAHLPRELTQHPALKQFPSGLSLVLQGPNPDESFMKIRHTHCCHRLTNAYTYSFRVPNTDIEIDMDVLCTLMPASITYTHEAHPKAHILYSLFRSRVQKEQCSGCGQLLRGVYYKCQTCYNFRLDARCAMLPNRVGHKFDEHPLKLINTTSESSSSKGLTIYCEICERGIDHRYWYYSCNECDQSFHTDCIRCLDRHSMIKFGVASAIHLECHECPVTLVRGRAVRGCRCGYCRETFKDYHTIALECSKCNFKIHSDCAQQCLPKAEARM